MGEDGPLTLPLAADSDTFVAQLARASTALERLASSSDGAKEKTEKQDAALKQLTDSIGKAADRAKDTFEVFEMWYERVLGAIEGVAALSTEAERLARVQDDLGVSLEEAQDNAVGFANETEIATAALSLQERGIRLTQQELNAMTRLASSYARQTGKEFAEAMEMVTEVVTEGGEEMGKLDLGLLRVASGSHTAGERLAAMVERAGQIEDSTDTATDAVERFKDGIHDLGVEAASAFNREFVRLASIAEDTRDAASATEDWKETFSALGETVGNVLVRAGEGAGALAGILGAGLGLVIDAVAVAGTGLSELAAGNFSGLLDRMEADFAARFERGEGFAGTAVQFARNRIAALERLSDETNDRTSLEPGNAPEGGPSPEAQRRNRRMRSTSNDALQGSGGGNADDGADRGKKFGARDRLRASDADYERRMRESDAYLDPQHEREAARQALDARKVAEQQRLMNEAFGRTDEGAFQNRQRDRQAELERRALEHRLDQRESFLDRWQRMNDRELVLNDVLAESLQTTFTSISGSLTDHLKALSAGKETAGQFWEGFAGDAMGALAEYAFGKAGLFLAESAGFLVMGNLGQAAAAFGASVAFGVAGAGLAAGAAAFGGGNAAPSTSAPSGGGGSAPSRPRLAGDAGTGEGRNTTTIVNHFYSPVISGREVGDAEVGTRLNRYTGASTRRLTRERT